MLETEFPRQRGSVSLILPLLRSDATLILTYLQTILRMPPKSPLSSLMAMAPPEMPADEPDTSQSTETPKDTKSAIAAPKGLQTPSGSEEGASFQGTFRGHLKEGHLHFESINNIPVGEGGDESKDDMDQEEEATESPEEESKEEDTSMEASPSDGYEDVKYKKKMKENSAFKKAFHA